MKAKELLRRYRTGERNFREVNLSGESLRGTNLTDIDLSGATLNNTDLRGTNFTDAALVGTQFCDAKTGTQRRWFILILLFSFLLSVIAAVLLGAGISFFLQQVVSQNSNNASENSVAGIVGLVVVLIALYFNYRRGILTTLGAGAIAGAIAIAGAVAVTGAVTVAISAAVASAVASAGAIAVASAGAGASAAAYPRSIIVASTSCISVVGAIAVAIGVAGTSSNSLLIIGLTATIVLSVTVLNIIISRRALSGDPRDQLIRDIAVGISCLGGTRFDNADLTDANFSKAIIKSAHFKRSTFRRTCFHLSKQLHLSRAYKTPLVNRTALNLLVSLRPSINRSYAGLNLKGAYLAHANFADLDLTETDLSDATLEGADLQRTTLTKLQALGTNFHQANLTAACIESWNIDSTTQLAGALCEHVYLLCNQQERRPNSGTFEPGEFSELFEEVLNTIDLIFRDGMDWQAFMQTFQTIQVEHEGAELEIQGIEKKANGVMVVRLDTHPEADKPAIHAAFKQDYELKLAAVETKYKALLASKEQTIDQKDELIQLHRQQSADMKSIAESLAQRPVTVDVTATANSKTGDETINIQGDANNSTVRIGDTLGDLESKGASREQAGEADG